MTMALEHKQVTRREDAHASVARETFTPDELAQILRAANSRQSSPPVATIEEALETARELGIDERHVMEAARELQEKKLRLEALRTRSRKQLMKLVRFLGTMAFVVTLVAVTAGFPPARIVAFGMSIAAIVMTAQWIRAKFDERFPPES